MLHLFRRFRLPQAPIVARSLGALLVLILATWLVPRNALAEAVLTESDVVRLARSESPVGRVASATDALASARERTAGLYPNPSLAWEREAITTTPTASEDVFVASIPIQLGRARAVRSLTAAEGAWMRAQASLARTNAVLLALLAYYDVALAEGQVELLGQAVENLTEAARVLASREAAGAVSGYESTRLAIASQMSRSRLAEARGELESARARLAALLGRDAGSLKVDGQLALAPPDTPSAAPVSSQRQAVRQARKAQQLAAEAEDRSDLAWLPSFELGAGLKHVSDTGGGYGYVLGVSVSLPIFDHGQAIRAEAQAQRTLSSARADALVREISVELQAAQVLYRAAREELARFEADTAGQVDALLRAAQSGYREGERSIVELLDAQRVQTEVGQRRLSLLAKAKRAEAKLRAAKGELQ